MIATTRNSFWLIILMRALLGLVIGGVTSITPTMLVEVAPSELTGYFGNLNQIGCVIGIIIINLQANWFVNINKPNGDRWWSLSVICAVFNAAAAGLIWLCSETGIKKDNENKEGEKKFFLETIHRQAFRWHCRDIHSHLQQWMCELAFHRYNFHLHVLLQCYS